jgi:hypothetical protein
MIGDAIHVCDWLGILGKTGNSEKRVERRAALDPE